MLKLHGFAVSNYFNMVKLALLEKGLPFEIVTVHGGQTPEFLAISPRGKVPVLQTEQGFINETSAILEYLEERGEGRALLPSEPYARARVRALMKEIELYLELPARSCYPEAFFGGKVDEFTKAKAKAELLAGVAALKRHATFGPYVAGEQFSLADLYFLYSVDLASIVAKKVFDFDLLAELPAAKALFALLNQNPHVQQIAADKEAGMAAFIASVKARG
ncbi:glutathione S-transferase family protein [Aquipseudomonas ullengensis]|uniref:Glutathione S-transferase family protein n=1 Tax=Aquipseudomonas ullengensis TaxID=2759166 RepID=A0A7W4LIY3_9GAMM|nr:glutathione S-transferase [Pseudomonas ullengensis]MBB2494033.1 glutathione S-transferase family protein [Pseudomonas ullengensis]